MSNTATYDAQNISVLEGLEAVRKRPGMYIGNTGKEGLHRCLGEILDNSVDECAAGFASEINVKINRDQVWVSDNGRGIPVDIHPKTGKTALETIMTVLHAGGKFNQDNYQFAGGLHGVGASVVNALSKKLEVWVLRDKQVYYLAFSKGKTIGEIQIFSEVDFAEKFPEANEMKVWKTNGTITSFIPDDEIFELTEFNNTEITESLKQTAYLNRNVSLTYKYNENEAENYHYPKGIVTYLENLTAKYKNLMEPVYFSGNATNFEMELAFVVTEDHNTQILPFTNGIFNSEGGMHLTGLRSALTKIIGNYALNKKLIKGDEKLTIDDIQDGFKAILAVKMVDAQFTSQSKVKLGSTIARTLTEKLVSEKLEIYFEENPKIAQTIIQKAYLAMRARLAARAARDNVLRKGVLDSMALPGKLADCSSKNPEESEIFIVEGDSAGGSAKQGRNRETQAILALRGKVLNTEKATLDKILNYEGIKNMILAFGCGIGEKFDKEKLRYHKIVLMTDADVDGAHIITLLLTFLYRYMRELIEEGYVYMARPPLYKLKAGKREEYLYSDMEKDALVREVLAKNPDQKIDIQRYKGLGEMNAEQLWDTTMNPKTRLLWNVTIGEAEIADLVFTELMGSEVAPRREFIEKNAKFLDEIDLV